MSATDTRVVIEPPNLVTAVFKIRGTAPLMMQAFYSRGEIEQQQREGKKAGRSTAKAAKNFESDAERSIHKSTEGWVGFPASAFRKAMIDACRLGALKMTMAKMSVFVLGDGFDALDGRPLVRIDVAAHEVDISSVRSPTGKMDVRARPMWREWGAAVRVRFDADQFGLQDVTNLLSRVGQQVGIGSGRPFSTNSCGMGLGTFEIVTENVQ